MRWIHLFLVVLAFAGCALWTPPCVAAPLAFSYDPAALCTSSATETVDVPAQEGKKALRLVPSMGQFGSVDIPLDHRFPRGRYRFEFTLSASNENAPRVSLYVIVNGSHEIINHPSGCEAGQVGGVAAYAYATGAFSSLAFKKMDATEAPSVAVSDIRITDLQDPTYVRLEGYIRIVQTPAPWGLRSPAIEERLHTAKAQADTDFNATLAALPTVEAWLDLRSVAAELVSRGDALLRATRLSEARVAPELSLTVDAALARLKAAVAEADSAKIEPLFDEVEGALTALESALSAALGGTVRPELGTDIFTWLKDWRLIGVDGDGECSEPTPYRTAYADGAVIRLFEDNVAATLASTWTTCTYRSASLDVTCSVLTPMIVADLKTDRLAMRTAGLIVLDTAVPEGSVVLVSAKNTYLVVTTTPFTSTNWKDGTLTLTFAEPGAAVGWVKLDGTDRADLAETAAFYGGILHRQPVECVQIQRGKEIEQIFECRLREGGSADAQTPIAPVPHLAAISLEDGSRLQVTPEAVTRTAVGGLTYVAGQTRLAYRLPERAHHHTAGINLWDADASPNAYTELKKQGCQTVRLVGGATRRWDWGTIDELRQTVQGHLERARAAGIVVGIDMHGLWDPGIPGPDGYNDPEKLEEFVRRWEAIIDWCKPYRDVVGWYDLLNEPYIFYEQGTVKPYAAFMRKALPRLRLLAGDTPFLVETVNMANPVGTQFWEDMGDANIIVGYHDYWPHMFTHQRCVEPGDRSMPSVPYPSFMPMIDWVTPSWRNTSPNWHYWDRWKCDAVSRPVLELMIRKGVRMDCGEYGVVGYAGLDVPRSGQIWLRHAMQRFRRLGINHNVWGVQGGFTWNIPALKAEILEFWAEGAAATTKKP